MGQNQNIEVKEDIIRISAYCMEYVKNTTKGISKNENVVAEKEFDLDRKRDDDSIIDV